MPKKKQPRNAFYFFMLDYKARCERNGERFPNGLRDVQLEAGPEWNNMPASAKIQYEEMAKKEKLRMKGDDTRKQTNWHNSFDFIDRQKMQEEDIKANMISDIERTISSLASSKGLLAEYRFYLIHVNYFCISEGECYHPAEIAIAEFSLGEGITNVYHTIINPGQIPLGYRHDAMQKSDSTHKIPVENNGGECNFYNILTNIKKFLQPGIRAHGGKYPPMYTMPDNVNLNTSIAAVNSVIETLCSCTDGDNPENFPIYPLERLFLELQSACNNISGKEEAFPAITFALNELEKDVFNYTPNISCSFHYNEDVVEYCSKSYVQRWVFLICDHCCQHLDITVIPGRHLPQNADVNYKKRQEVEENKVPKECRPITWIDHSKKQQPSGSNWVPRELAPVQRPRKQANLAALLPNDPETIDVSEDSFPSMPVGRGRGRLLQGADRGNSAPLSFAQAMKQRK